MIIISKKDISNKVTNRIKGINPTTTTNPNPIKTNNKTSLPEIPIIAIPATTRAVEDLQADQKSNKQETLSNY